MPVRSSVSARPSNQGASSSQTIQNEEQELYACKSCHSWHYVEKCIYCLSWKEWLEYHQEYMPSEPVPERVGIKGGRLVNLHENIDKLDDPASDYRYFHVPNTRMKADLMTRSSKQVLLEEQQKVNAERRKVRQADFAKEVEQGRHMDEGSEDELA